MSNGSCVTCNEPYQDVKCKTCDNTFCYDCKSICDICTKCTICTEEGETKYQPYDHVHERSNKKWYVCQECKPCMNFEDDYIERRDCKICKLK